MSRQTVSLLLTLVTFMVLASGVALAATVICEAGRFCEGTPGDDTMNGSAAGGEEMHGLGGSDDLRGFGGFDLLSGGPDNDHLRGGGDGDTYHFEDGWGSDSVRDTAGYDALDLSPVTTPVVVNLNVSISSPEARSGPDRVNLHPDTVVEQAQGTAMDDFISGNGADNSLEGDHGNDRIKGLGGADGIGGGGGNDTLTGGRGPDIIWARSGDDIIYVVDDEPDEVNCGDGADTVHFDVDLDTLGSKCDNLKPASQP